MYTLKDRLEDISTKDLLRVINTNKEYIVFNYHVFNVGAKIDVICTDHFERYNKYLEDGYSFVISLYTEEYETIKEILTDRLKEINNSWFINCYYFSFELFLKEKFNISYYNYMRLIKLNKGS